MAAISKPLFHGQMLDGLRTQKCIFSIQVQWGSEFGMPSVKKQHKTGLFTSLAFE